MKIIQIIQIIQIRDVNISTLPSRSTSSENRLSVRGVTCFEKPFLRHRFVKPCCETAVWNRSVRRTFRKMKWNRFFFFLILRTDGCQELKVILPSGTGTTALFLARHLSPTGIAVYAIPCAGDGRYLHRQMAKVFLEVGQSFPLFYHGREFSKVGQASQHKIQNELGLGNLLKANKWPRCWRNSAHRNRKSIVLRTESR